MFRSRVTTASLILLFSLTKAVAQEGSPAPESATGQPTASEQLPTATEQMPSGAEPVQIPPPPATPPTEQPTPSPTTETAPAETPAVAAPAPPAPKPAPRKPAPRRVVRRAPPPRSDWSFGAVYLMWSEGLSIAKNGLTADGFANYGGIGVAMEYTRTTQNWVFAGTGVFAVGKASSDGFVGVAYPDGVDRPWTAIHVSGTAGYRINPVFSIGPGLLLRTRAAQWESADPLLEITPDKGLPAAPQLVLRWVLGNKIALTQTFAPVDMHGNTLWQWDGQWIF